MNKDSGDGIVLEVEKVERVENATLFLEYAGKRLAVATDLKHNCPEMTTPPQSCFTIEGANGTDDLVEYSQAATLQPREAGEHFLFFPTNNPQTVTRSGNKNLNCDWVCCFHMIQVVLFLQFSLIHIFQFITFFPGLDQRFSEHGAFGEGMYFADNAMDADRVVVPVVGESHHMVIARVAVGHCKYVMQGNEGRRVSLSKEGDGAGEKDMYHSVVTRTCEEDPRSEYPGDQRLFVVYERTQSYPELIVTYKRRSGYVPQERYVFVVLSVGFCGCDVLFPLKSHICPFCVLLSERHQCHRYRKKSLKHCCRSVAFRIK